MRQVAAGVGTSRLSRPGADWMIGAFWLAASFALSFFMMSADYRPGRVGVSSGKWPLGTVLPLASGTETVVAFLHPRCVCTRATIKQLIQTLKPHPEAALVVPVFVPEQPAGREDWEQGEYVRTLRESLPGARLVYDPGGKEARRFGALTSGTVLVYGPRGDELFRGGITDRRGGEADNPGVRRLGGILDGGSAASPTPVFGCPLVPAEDWEKRKP